MRDAEQIVIVSHHFLISADQQNGDVIRLGFFERMQRQNSFDIVQINKFFDHAVRIAGDVAKRRVFGRYFI